MTKLILAIFFLHAFAAAQQVSNKEFVLAVSPAGVTSLKRVRDAYDTDYILAGRTPGDILVRYRSPGGAWKEASSATSAAVNASDTEINYKIGRAVPTIATASRKN